MKKTLLAACAAVTLCALHAAHATPLVQTFDFTTPGLPTWVRPDENTTDHTAAPTSLFGPGSYQYEPGKSPMAYFAVTFQVDTAGTYTFFSYHPNDKGDLFTLLYQGSFDANAPLANVLTSNDDAYRDPTGKVWWVDDPNVPWQLQLTYGSGFDYTLAAHTTYVLVNTLFAGNYIVTGADKIDTLTITGPGSVVAVPEPATVGLVAAALALAGVASRRRQLQG